MYLSKVEKKRAFYFCLTRNANYYVSKSIENWVGKTKRRCSRLKILSSEMDPAEIRLIRKI
jgi:hypothetical protein